MAELHLFGFGGGALLPIVPSFAYGIRRHVHTEAAEAVAVVRVADARYIIADRDRSCK